jgi:hypothetical protein
MNGLLHCGQPRHVAHLVAANASTRTTFDPVSPICSHIDRIASGAQPMAASIISGQLTLSL